MNFNFQTISRLVALCSKLQDILNIFQGEYLKNIVINVRVKAEVI